jgi:hypothetical protein
MSNLVIIFYIFLNLRNNSYVLYTEVHVLINQHPYFPSKLINIEGHMYYTCMYTYACVYVFITFRLDDLSNHFRNITVDTPTKYFVVINNKRTDYEYSKYSICAWGENNYDMTLQYENQRRRKKILH